MKKYKYKFTTLQDIKYVLSFVFRWFSFLFPASKRPEGISVMCLVKDEADWVKLSLESLQGFADEVIMIDNGSSDDTLAILHSMQSKLSYELIIRENPDPDFCQVSNQALALTKYRWIMRWGADFIAYTSGERNLKNLRQELLSLPQKKHYLIYPLIVNFSGDLFHVKKGFELHSEHYIHTWHKNLKFRKIRRFCTLTLPFFYRVIRDRRIWIAHIGSAKRYDKLIYRYFWVDWRSRRDFIKYPTIKEFVRKEYKLEWGSSQFKEFMQNVFYEMIFSRIRKYNTEEFGEYPDLLKEHLTSPSFTITYKDGKPYSRSDF